jgi:hypothetical protein
MSQYVGHLVASRMQARNLDLFFAGFPVPNESVTIARRCPRPEVHVIGALGRLGLFGWFRACLRCRRVGCGNSRCKPGLFDGFGAGRRRRRVGCGNSRCNMRLSYLAARLGVILQRMKIGLQRRLLRHLLRAAAPGADGCKDKNSRYKKRAPNYPIRCCHVRTLNQLSSATCQAHPASPPRWIRRTAA